MVLASAAHAHTFVRLQRILVAGLSSPRMVDHFLAPDSGYFGSCSQVIVDQGVVI